MAELTKKETIITFINNILTNETPENINNNRIFIIKALRLLNDDTFWQWYKHKSDIRKQSKEFIKNYIYTLWKDSKKYGPDFLWRKNDQENIKKIKDILFNNIKNLDNEEQKALKLTFSGLIEDSVRFKQLRKIERKFYDKDDDLIIMCPLTRDYFSSLNHDVSVLAKFIEKIIFYNEIPTTFEECTVNFNSDYFDSIKVDDEEFEKYKCKLITDEDKNVAFIKIYKDTKKQNIIDFVAGDNKKKDKNKKDKGIFDKKIKPFFTKNELDFKEWEELEQDKDELMVPDKRNNIEKHINSEYFYRDLKIYKYSEEGKSVTEIQELLEQVETIEDESVIRYISKMKKLFQESVNNKDSLAYRMLEQIFIPIN